MGNDSFLKLYESSLKNDRNAFFTALDIIKSGCNAGKEDGARALLALSSWGDARGVEWLLAESGPVDHSHVTYAGANALMWAAKGNHKACVELALSFCDPNWCSKYGVTALMYAAQKGSDKAVGLLLPVSNIEQVDARGKSALIHARESGHSLVESQILAAKEARDLNDVVRTRPSTRNQKRV